MLLVLRTPKVVTAQHCWGGTGAYWGRSLCSLTRWRWMLLVLRTPKVVTAQHCWGYWGLLRALALLAYWVALDAVGFANSEGGHGATLLGVLGLTGGARFARLLGGSGCCC